MSSRHPPSGDSHYTPRDRDRSPFRLERRGSINSVPVRNSDNSYRPADSNANSRDVLGAPRGPSGRGTSSYPTRGGSYIGRETRGGRDVTAQFYRRDSDRDFSRRDNDRRISPSRNRSRTPPTTRDFRDVRDNRDTPLRSLDMTRVTRDARENGSLSAVSAASSSEGPSSGSNYHRNFSRSLRGRGDRDRGPARRNFDERDSFRPRSRSRDRWDRDHDRGRDHDRDTRRDDDIRDRDSDRLRRDPPPVRPDSRNSVTSQPTSAGGTIHMDRRDPALKQPFFPADTPRRTSFAHASGRPDLPRLSSTSAQTPSSPVQYPQVPEFGLGKPTIPTETPKPAPLPSPREESSLSLRTDSGGADPIKIAPRGPKADLALQQQQQQQQQMALKAFARRPGFPADQSPATRRFESVHDTSLNASPVTPRFGPSASPPFANAPLNRPHNPTRTPDLVTKPGQTFFARQETRSQHENDIQRPAEVKIPTGPKADRDPSLRTPLSARTNKPAAMIWVNPNRQLPSLHKPSIMQSMHSKKDDENMSQPLASSPGTEIRTAKVTDGEAAARRASADMPVPRRSILSPGYPPSAMQGLRKDTDEDDNADTMDDEDEDEEDDEEDNAELDQQDFEKAEARFKKQIELLRNKLVPEPSRNPKIIAALENIDIYASAIEDYKNGYVPPPETIGKDKAKGTAVLSPTLSTRPVEIPTPPAETTQVKDEDDKDHIKEVVMIDLPLDGLIYLDKNRLTPASFNFEDTEAEEDELCDRVRHTLALDRSEDDQFRDHYAELYFRWREEVDTFDEENAQQEALATRAATPMSVVGTETATTPIPESGRRSARNATEMDLERVIKESAEEAQAAEMAQVPVDMSVEPDMTREADIPDMLTEADQELFVFEDLNNRIPNVSDIMVMVAPEDNPVFKAYDYLPPPDDFDSDDQERFMDAYAKFPKQWGALARNMNEAASQMEMRDESQLPPKRRDYHQCILHYYMTKKQAKPAYKLLPNRKSRAKKKTGPAGRRANQRSSMLGGGEDGGVRMSDTGRPKRAAAPSFNDKEKRDAEVLAQKAAIKEKKASTLLNKPAADGASGTEKVGRKKGKKGEKVMKRGAKGAQLAPNVSAGQTDESGTDLGMQNAYGSRDLEGAQLLAELHGYAGHSSNPSQSSPAFPKSSQNETWRIDPRAQLPNQQPQLAGTMSTLQQPIGVTTLDTGVLPRALSASTQESVFPVRQPSPQVTGQPGGASNNHTPGPTSTRAAGGPNSYWTVPERLKFLEAVKAYGKDWPAIAKCISTKTETMVENFFKKGGKNSNDPEEKRKLEELALEAEARIAQYGPSPPVEPLAHSTSSGNGGSRRRAAPASQRALAPNPEPAPQPIMPASTLADSHVVPSPAHVHAQAQELPQTSSHPRIAPARPTASPAASVTEIPPPPARIPLSPQSARTQSGIAQPQFHTAPYTANPELDRSRNGAPILNESVSSLQMLQSKRPRSISEQDRHILEQPPKRQGLSSEEFTKLMALQHEQQHQQQQQQHQSKMQHVMQSQQQPQIVPQQQYSQQQQQLLQQQRPPPQLQSQAPLQQPPPQQLQHQQRTIHRSDSQQGYDYRQPPPPPPPPASQPTYSQPIRSVSSATEEFDRYRRAPSPSQYHKERDPYAPTHHRQEMAANINSMANVMSASRGYEHSPRQHIPAELPRPSSIAPSRSIPAPPQKISSIMSLLNNDPPEEKKVADSRPIMPNRHDPQPTNPTIHHPAPQPGYQRRETIDPARDSHSQRGFAQPVYSASSAQPQSYNQPGQPYVHPSQHPHQARDSYQQHRPYYPESGRPLESSRPVYQQAPSAVSPPPAQQSVYHVPGPTYDVSSHAHVGPPTSHSRGSSYTMHANSSGVAPSAVPGGALESSRYASMRPLGPPQNMSHHPPTSSSQHHGYHPTNQGPLTMSGPSRAANAYPGQLGPEHRRVEEQSGIPRYGTPSHTPPNNSRYGGYAPPPPPPV